MEANVLPMRGNNAAADMSIGLEILRSPVPKGVERQGHPLVFLHGAFVGAWCWADHFLGYFARRGFDCYAPSFRGHGGSDGIADISAFGIEDYIQDILLVMEDLQDPPILIGHSMGGFIAMKLAERRDLAGLALLSSVPPAGLSGPSLSLAMWNPRLLSEIGMVQRGRPDAITDHGLRDALFSPRISPSRASQYISMMGPESLRAMREMHGLIQVHPNRLRKRVPIFVMGGAEDGLIAPAFIRSTARQFGQRALILPEMGHALMLENNWEQAAAPLANWAAIISNGEINQI